MISVAVLGDLLQILLTLTVFLAVADDIVTIISEGFIAVWFFFRGVRYFGGKRSLQKAVTMFVMTVVELVPVLNAIPTLTIGTIAIIRASRAEDREEFKERQEQAHAAEAARVDAATNRAYDRHFRNMAEAARIQEQELEDA